FVSDLRAATVAIEGIRALSSSVEASKTRDSITALDSAFRILESAHDLQEMLDGFVFLAIGERWQIATPRARTAAPRDWNWLEQRIHQVPEEFSRLAHRNEPVRKTLGEAGKILAEAAKDPGFRATDQEMTERRKPDHDA